MFSLSWACSLGVYFLNLSCEPMVLNKLGVVDYVCSTGRVVVGMTLGKC
jgi:hypothetical protein